MVVHPPQNRSLGMKIDQIPFKLFNHSQVNQNKNTSKDKMMENKLKWKWNKEK
jgi:hypothetical protein